MIAAYAPATVSNVACGFDVLGFALQEPGDIVLAEPQDAPGVRIAAVQGDDGRLSHDPRENTAGAAVAALLARLGTTRGVTLTIHKGLPLASGLGSSGASAVAALVAANELLGRPASLDLLLACAMEGERAGCGAAHPDNVAPALYGGFVLARHGTPVEVVTLPIPAGLCCVVLHPQVELMTRAARAAVGDSVPLSSAVQQASNVGSLVSALFRNDFGLLARSLVDVIAEPHRAPLVPGFRAVQQAARSAGALGSSFSGSGPSMFALCVSLSQAREVAAAMRKAFEAATPGVGADVWWSDIAPQGARVIAGTHEVARS